MAKRSKENKESNSGMNGYKRDTKNPAIFVPCKQIHQRELRWSNEEIKHISLYCDSPTFIDSLIKYNELDKSARKNSNYL